MAAASSARTAPVGDLSLVGVRRSLVGKSLTAAAVLTIATLYAAPFVKAILIDQLPRPAAAVALPPLSLPSVSFPLLRVPKLVHLPALPPLAAAAKPAPPRVVPATARPVAKHSVKHVRVAVISSVTNLAPPAPKTPTHLEQSPPVVTDEIGTVPTSLPATAAA